MGQTTRATSVNASAAAAAPWSSPAVSPVTRFFQAGLTSVGAKFNVAAYFMVKWSSAFQLFLLKHPNVPTKLVLALFYLYEALVTALDKDPEQATLYERKLKYLGPNFPIYAGVMVGDINVVRQIMLSPQKRGPYIAWGRQVAKAYPDNMLLFLSDKAAGGSGEREQIKAILTELFTSEAVLNRGKDEVAQSLVSAFAKEVKSGTSNSLPFATTYILYVVFGVLPDKATTDLVSKVVPGYSRARVWPLGLFKRGLSPDEQKVRALLAGSPLVKGADLKGYDRERFLDALMPILNVAAIPGPATFIWYATTLLPSTFKWNYGSDEANLNAVYEAMRTHPPVASVTSIAQQPVEIDIGGEVHRFPPGTKIMYNMKTASKDPSIHADALKVDVTRKNLAEHVLNFASFGPENYGRQCPGRKVAEQLGIDLFRNLGNLEFTTSNA